MDLLFTKKTQMFVLSHTEDQCDHFETLFSKCIGGTGNDSNKPSDAGKITR